MQRERYRRLVKTKKAVAKEPEEEPICTQTAQHEGRVARAGANLHGSVPAGGRGLGKKKKRENIISPPRVNTPGVCGSHGNSPTMSRPQQVQGVHSNMQPTLPLAVAGNAATQHQPVLYMLVEAVTAAQDAAISTDAAGTRARDTHKSTSGQQFLIPVSHLQYAVAPPSQSIQVVSAPSSLHPQLQAQAADHTLTSGATEANLSRNSVVHEGSNGEASGGDNSAGNR
ncbi:hypothetical protein F443_03893 [Phytophthora nicotianae P1569]|uniref:Uncharacterized protein n=4 Tax=Phytophthora nicotianae TaxID=4792 RepID=V9FRT7_PHYNI|nr:hypothetical protein F443_03893 [Phytophthora nicotianae P1569]